MLKKLNRTTVPSLSNRPVKVIQFGDGNFLRAFLDWFIDIMNEQTSFNGAVQIIAPLRSGKTKANDDQDGLYHVFLNGLHHGKLVSEARLITSITGTINPYTHFQQFLYTAENPELEFIVSNTTEMGIVFNPNDKHPDEIGESFPAKATQLLYHRFKFFGGDVSKGLIFLPCELIEHNGLTLRELILNYADVWNLPKEFNGWVSEHNLFCDTLVDRIVSGFPKNKIDEIQQTIGYEDHQLVCAEPFYQLVIQPHFTASKTSELLHQKFPVLEAGLDIQFVPDVTPYRLRKVRILNGAHTTLMPVAYLRGLRTVKEAMDDIYINEFVKKALFEEIIPTLDLPTAELTQFANDTLERFQNPFIKHELITISLNSISKYRLRVVPSVITYHRQTGKLPVCLLHSLATLIVFYRGSWKGESIAVNDIPSVLSFFESLKHESNEAVVDQVLTNIDFWGQDLTDVEGLADVVKKNIKQLTE